MIKKSTATAIKNLIQKAEIVQRRFEKDNVPKGYQDEIAEILEKLEDMEYDLLELWDEE